MACSDKRSMSMSMSMLSLLSSPSVRHSPVPVSASLHSIQFPSLGFASTRCDAIRFHSILHPSSSDHYQGQCQCRQKRKRLMHSCNFLWPITCCKLANLGTLAESIKNKSYWQIHLNLLCPACRRPLPASTFLPSLSSDPSSCPCLSPSPHLSKW